MKKILAVIITFITCTYTMAQKKDTRYYELRVYYCHPGKLDALIERFTNHTTKLFEKHGMENIGYWVPINNTENALYYVLAYPDKEARDASWKGFMNDPVWKEVARKSEENGKIVAKVSSTFMTAASEITPAIKASATGKDRSFELRTYHCYPGQLPKLIKRFKDHTLNFFTQYGMTHIAYWTTIEENTDQSKLVYILAYPSEAAGVKAFEQFRADPAWQKVKTETETPNPIVEKVESVPMKPLSFSKIK